MESVTKQGNSVARTTQVLTEQGQHPVLASPDAKVTHCNYDTRTCPHAKSYSRKDNFTPPLGGKVSSRAGIAVIWGGKEATNRRASKERFTLEAILIGTVQPCRFRSKP